MFDAGLIGRSIAFDNKCWCATVGRGCNAFAEFEEEGGPEPGAERKWRINFQRSAALSSRADRERTMSDVVYPPPEKRRELQKPGVEWAVWNPPYARIDCVDRLGTVVMA